MSPGDLFELVYMLIAFPYDDLFFQEIRSAELRTEIAQVLHGYKEVCRQRVLFTFVFSTEIK
jgi:hypothetical protein